MAEAKSVQDIIGEILKDVSDEIGSTIQLGDFPIMESLMWGPPGLTGAVAAGTAKTNPFRTTTGLPEIIAIGGKWPSNDAMDVFMIFDAGDAFAIYALPNRVPKDKETLGPRRYKLAKMSFSITSEGMSLGVWQDEIVDEIIGLLPDEPDGPEPSKEDDDDGDDEPASGASSVGSVPASGVAPTPKGG